MVLSTMGLYPFIPSNPKGEEQGLGEVTGCAQGHELMSSSNPGPCDSTVPGQGPLRLHHRILQLEDLEATCVSEATLMGDGRAWKEN